MSNFIDDLTDYILSGHSLLQIRTHEKDRCVEEIKLMAKTLDKQFYSWSAAKGWEDENHREMSGSSSAEDSLAFVDSIDNNGIFVLKDFNLYLNIERFSTADIIISTLYETQDVLSNTRKVILFIGIDNYMPENLRHTITCLEFSLPNEESIQKAIRFVVESAQDGNDKFEFNETDLPWIVNACKGLTQQEVIDRVALAIRKHKKLDRTSATTILREKAKVIRASGTLNYVEPPVGGLDIVGGYDALKEYIKIDAPCFSQEARDYGVDYPKGLMFIGVPGAGKTLISIAIASEFGFPLIKMDVGNLMNKYVGESEANMQSAINTLEVIAPCVLLLDEIEKGFSGIGADDNGPLRRMFGTFLQWLNDRTSPVYVVATANNIASLPPEFLRTGRFDAIFGLDLPNELERSDIIKIHLNQRQRTLQPNELQQIVRSTKDFTGSDIEQAIKLGIKLCFAIKDRKQEKLFDHIVQACEQTIPLIKTEPERIQRIREWCDARARQSSYSQQKESVRQRQITL